MAPKRQRDQGNRKDERERVNTEIEQLSLLIQERDKAQATAQERLIQVQTDGARNMAEVASSLSKLHGAQQDTHDVLGALERTVVEHDTQLQQLIKDEESRILDNKAHQETLTKLMSEGCSGCQNLQRDNKNTLESSLQALTKEIHESNKHMQEYIKHQIGMGRILVAIGGVATAVAALIGLIASILAASAS